MLYSKKRLSALGDDSLHDVNYKVFLEMPHLANSFQIKLVAELLAITESEVTGLLANRKEPFLLCEGNVSDAYFCIEKISDHCVFTCVPEFPFERLTHMRCETCGGETTEKVDSNTTNLYCEACQEWAYRQI